MLSSATQLMQMHRLSKLSFDRLISQYFEAALTRQLFFLLQLAVYQNVSKIHAGMSSNDG